MCLSALITASFNSSVYPSYVDCFAMIPSATRPAVRMPKALFGALRFGLPRIVCDPSSCKENLTRIVVYHNSHFDVLRCNHSRLGPMKRVPATFLPPIALDHRTKTPMYRQLYDWFRRAIIDGQMRPGQRVPSTRGLAAELKISRIPVLNAYEQLLAEGYLETFVGAGTCVAKSIPDDTLSPPVGSGRKGFQEIVAKLGTRRLSQRAVALTRSPAQPWLN